MIAVFIYFIMCLYELHMLIGKKIVFFCIVIKVIMNAASYWHSAEDEFRSLTV